MPTPNTERLWTKWSFLTVQKSCLRVNGILRSLSAIGYATCPPDYSELDGGALQGGGGNTTMVGDLYCLLCLTLALLLMEPQGKVWK